MTENIRVGDKLWIASFETIYTQVPCYACYGQKYLEVILGNGEHIQIACRYCRRPTGYDEPTGYVYEEEYKPVAREITIESIRSEQGKDGIVKYEYRYRNAGDHPSMARIAGDIFSNEADAKEAAWKLQIELALNEVERNRKSRKRARECDDVRFSVGYHRREAASHRKQAEYHESAVTLIKEQK